MSLRPSEEAQIDSFEKDMDRIKGVYRYGYDLTFENAERIRNLFAEKG